MDTGKALTVNKRPKDDTSDDDEEVPTQDTSDAFITGTACTGAQESIGAIEAERVEAVGN